MKLIKLSKSKYGDFSVMVDDEDFEELNKRRWYPNKRDNAFYATTRIGKDKVFMHRLLMGCKNGDGKIIDHKDRNTLNYQRKNLRFCTPLQNQFNKSSQINSSSIYLGVTWSKQIKRWVAAIKINGKRKHLGCFIDEKLAAIRYNEVALEYRGEFANLNIIK